MRWPLTRTDAGTSLALPWALLATAVFVAAVVLLAAGLVNRPRKDGSL